MSARQVLPVCLSAVLPGCGHIAAGRPAKGLLLFLLFGFAVDGILYGHTQGLLPAGEANPLVPTLAWIGGLGLWAYAVGDTVHLALRARRIAAKADVVDAHMRQALVAYLAEDLESAAAALRSALRVNPQDADALFYLGVVHAAAGRRGRARRALRRCARYDVTGKWDREVEARLRALDSAPPAEPAAPPAKAEKTDREVPQQGDTA